MNLRMSYIMLQKPKVWVYSTTSEPHYGWLQLLRSQLQTAIEYCDKSESQLSTFLLSQRIKFAAVNCARALLEGEGDWSNSRLHKPGLYPLHAGAEALSPKMIAFCENYRVHNTPWRVVTIDVTVKSIRSSTKYSLKLYACWCSWCRRTVYWTQQESLSSLLAHLTGQRMANNIVPLSDIII